MVTFVNGKKYKLDDKLQENDEVKLVTLVMGG
jgi:sulfur carrier protein ThiS